MDKIETPEEFAQSIKDGAFDPWCWNPQEKQYTGEFNLTEAVRLIAARDAAIRKTCTNKLWDKLIKLYRVGEKI